MSLGILAIDKPSGMTSFDVVRAVKKITGIKKIGHGGTLDPMASGVLPILLNEATGLFDVLLGFGKIYDAEIQLGIATNTDDKDGQIIENKSIPDLSLDEINDKIALFTGEILQIPPQFSALKVNGKRAYDLARSGEDVDLRERKIIVYSWKDIRYNALNQTISAKIHCGSGTYIRSLARDLSKTLGTVGHLSALHRISSGGIDIEKSINLETLSQDWSNHILSMEEVLHFVKPLMWYGSREHLKYGKPLSTEFCSLVHEEGLYKLLLNNKIVALVSYEDCQLKYKKNFIHLLI